MRIALAQYDPVIGDVEGNAAKVREGVEVARKKEADLVVFPELIISGYPPQDLLEHDAFVKRCLDTVETLAKENTGPGIILGAPSFVQGHEGKKRYNSAFLLANGEVRSVHHKSLLPDYDVFDEYRHFEAAPERSLILFGGERIALTICEDLWDLQEGLGYSDHPMKELADQGATLMINIAASPFDRYHPELRRALMAKNAREYQLPLFYAANVGAQTDLIFDGGSMVLNAEGERVAEMPYFKSAVECFDTERLERGKTDRLPDPEERIYRALLLGLRDFFGKLGMKKAIVGLSGGIDSALTCAITCDALGADNVYAVMMPSDFSSEHSVEDSRALVKNLACPSDLYPIRSIYEEYHRTLAPAFEGSEFGLAEENLQARSRAVLLMALSNKFGQLLLNTSNKSELAVGYGTLYGDLCGALSVIGDLYKTEAYRLAEHLNRHEERIPRSIIEKAPSAELKPEQRDTDSLPPYEELDEILYRYIEERKEHRSIVTEGFDESTVKEVLKAVDSSEFKRYQAAPVLRISKKAFGIGRRMPLIRSFTEPGGSI
ncbi:MAG: NAD+ synthase [Flavobacteriales bacterium]